jgi:hypothetical protein
MRHASHSSGLRRSDLWVAARQTAAVRTLPVIAAISAAAVAIGGVVVFALAPADATPRPARDGVLAFAVGGVRCDQDCSVTITVTSTASAPATFDPADQTALVGGVMIAGGGVPVGAVEISGSGAPWTIPAGGTRDGVVTFAATGRPLRQITLRASAGSAGVTVRLPG